MSLNIDSYRFGNTKAGICLVKELNRLDDKKLAKTLGRYFSTYCFYLNQLDKIEYITRTHSALLILNDFKRLIAENCYEWPGNVRDLFLNVLSSAYHKHTCWKIEYRELTNQPLGKCQICDKPTAGRLLIHKRLTAKYCRDHIYLLDAAKNDALRKRDLKKLQD